MGSEVSSVILNHDEETTLSHAEESSSLRLPPPQRRMRWNIFIGYGLPAGVFAARCFDMTSTFQKINRLLKCNRMIEYCALRFKRRQRGDE